MPASQRKTFPATSSNMLRKKPNNCNTQTKAHGTWLMTDSKSNECCTQCHHANNLAKKV